MTSLFISLLLLVVLLGCNNSKPGSPGSDSAKAGAAKSPVGEGSTVTLSSDSTSSTSGGSPPNASTPPMRYGPESAEVEMRSEAMGEKITATLYFDRHGARQATFTTIDVVVDGKPMQIRNVSVVDSGWSILYDPKKKVATKGRLTEGVIANLPDFGGMTAEQKQKFQYKTLEPRTIAGKQTTGHSFTRGGTTVKVWIWEGIPLRTETDYGTTQPLVSEAVSVKTGVPVDLKKFEIPSDIKITEVGAMK